MTKPAPISYSPAATMIRSSETPEMRQLKINMIDFTYWSGRDHFKTRDQIKTSITKGYNTYRIHRLSQDIYIFDLQKRHWRPDPNYTDYNAHPAPKDEPTLRRIK